MIGISSSAFSLSSISKHRGAEISSRLIPQNPSAIFFTVCINSSTSCVPTIMGNASIPANSRKRTHFPSMTGRLARCPIFPRPSTADPSVTTATVRALRVRSSMVLGSARIARQGSATHGEYAHERSSRVSIGTSEWVPSFP